MGRKSRTGGVTAKGKRRIQYEFKFEGVRYRPTLPRVPTEANLRRAREQLAGIKERVDAGTFSFAEEFPEFRNLKDVPNQGSPQTCAQVFDAFLAHCESRETKGDMATVTVACYRRILNGIWRPNIGAVRFLDVQYSTLMKVADNAKWSKKSYNNAISVVRRAFKFGYRDYPEKHDPTTSLRSARIRKQDRPDSYVAGWSDVATKLLQPTKSYLLLSVAHDERVRDGADYGARCQRGALI